MIKNTIYEYPTYNLNDIFYHYEKSERKHFGSKEIWEIPRVQMETENDAQSITLHVEPNDGLLKRNISRSSTHSLDEVSHLPMNALQALHVFHFFYHDVIENWLEESFVNKFIHNCMYSILLNVNGYINEVIISIYHYMVFQLLLLVIDFYFLKG